MYQGYPPATAQLLRGFQESIGFPPYPKLIRQKSLLLGLDSCKSSLSPLLIPLISPNGWADLSSKMPHGLASLLTVGSFHAKQPLIVPVPAVIGLVLRREARVTGGGADGLDFAEKFFLFRGELANGGSEDFVEFVVGDVRHGFTFSQANCERENGG